MRVTTLNLNLIALTLLAVGGCGADVINPSFPLTLNDAEPIIEQIRESPAAPPRPLVLLGGWIDPGIVTTRLRRELAPAFDDPRIVTVSFAFKPSFDVCRQRCLDHVDAAFPTDDPTWTTEVDVVAISMGGLIARYAAAPIPGRRRLRIARLFTIATPHRGAAMATFPTLDPLVRDMRAGSDLLGQLDAELAEARYPLVPYVRLGDAIVGANNAAPDGETPWWVPNAPFQFAHLNAARDRRILADIMLRLRGEEPITTRPRAPLPVTEPAG